MPYYKMQWILNKQPGTVHTGPVIGIVKDRKFYPFNETKVKTLKAYFDLNYKKGKHFIKEESTLTSKDVTELFKIHPYFDTIHKISFPSTESLSTWYDEEGNEILDLDFQEQEMEE